jgi:protein ImuB
VILYAPVRGRMVVTVGSTGADHSGVRPGMPLAEARALQGPQSTAHYEVHDPHADQLCLKKLAQWCERFSPWVALEEAEYPDSLLLDIAGCDLAFDSEEKLTHKVVNEFRRRSFWIEVAIADTIGAALALTRARKGEGEKGREGEKQAPLSLSPLFPFSPSDPLPVESMRLPDSILQLLRDFDLRTVEQLLQMPRTDLIRLGPEVLHRIDQMLGTMPELLTPQKPEQPVEVSWAFEPATDDLRVIEAALGHLLERALKRLGPRQVGIQKFICTLETTARSQNSSGSRLDEVIGLLQPSLSVKRLLELAHMHFERLQLPGEVSGITLRVLAAATPEFEQGQLFEEDPGAARWKKLPALIESLSNRLGEKAVLRPRLWPDAQPELACRYAPWLKGDRETRRQGDKEKGRRGERETERSFSLSPCLPVSLSLHPSAVQVMSVVPGGPPLRFEWNKENYVVAHYWGPERIETGWWRGCDVQRDYYLVETAEGKRFWLFRRRSDEHWFLHGSFA